MKLEQTAIILLIVIIIPRLRLLLDWRPFFLTELLTEISWESIKNDSVYKKLIKLFS